MKVLKRIFQFKRMWLLCAAPAAVLLVFAAKADNRWVENFFHRFIYKPVSCVIGAFTSLFAFSVTELLVLLAALGIIYYIVRVIMKARAGSVKHELYKAFVNVLCVLSAAFFMFEICMGLNYYRYTAAYHMNLDVRESTVDELYELAERLKNDMNSARAQLSEDENGVARLSDDSIYKTSAAAREAYKRLSEKYTFLKTADIRNKPLISSKLFSAVMTTGIYIPYTFESNINVDVPEFTIPHTMCHELTHFRGFMRENEANFLGYLACMETTRADFKYSASLLAFSYCYPRLSKADPQRAAAIAADVSDAVLRDLRFEDEYWEKYRNTVTAEVSDKVYNGYLKSNNQQSGTQSYGEMVDLLLAYYRQ